MIKIFVVGFIFLVVSLVTLTAVDNNNKKQVVEMVVM